MGLGVTVPEPPHVQDKRAALAAALSLALPISVSVRSLLKALEAYVLDVVGKGPHDRPDCPCGHPFGTRGPCGACNCADDDGDLSSLAQDAPPKGPQSVLEQLRSDGWRVAVHNDYMLNGELHTFWGLTRGCCFVKGEGRTDGEALADAQRGIERLKETQR